MGTKKVTIGISMSKSLFLQLLLLGGKIEVTTADKEKMTLSGIDNHIKFGRPGVEDGEVHTFHTSVEYDNNHYTGEAKINAQKGGRLYKGTVTFFAKVHSRLGIDVPD